MADMKYTVVRSSKRRKVTISVERDRKVIVHAPDSASDEKIARVVELKKRWILDKISHPQKYGSLPHPPGKELVNGESALYLGRNYRIELSDRNGGEVEFAQIILVPGSTQILRREALRRWYETRAAEVILPRAHHYRKELGVNYGSAKITDNRYRWGSCTKNGNVSFNWRLIKAPMMAVNYVVVHELAHLLEPNHGPDFWNVVRTQLPSAERARQWLKDHGDILETEL